MWLKQKLKSFIQKHAGLPLFHILRVFYTPPPSMRKSLLFRGRFKVKTKDKRSFYLFNDRFYLETNFFWLGLDNHHWEILTRKIWTKLCVEADTILDVGANTGIYSVLAKTYNPNAQVYAFEPQHNVFEVLIRNNRINNYDIVYENLALSNTDGRQPFYNYGHDTFKCLNTTAGSLNKDWKPQDQHATEVEVVRLENYLRQKGVSKVDLVKIDVETLEFEVLLGYGELLFEHGPIIILEIQSVEIGSNIQRLLDGRDFHYFRILETDGLLAVNTLGSSEAENKNYLLMPSEKIDLISMFEVSNSREDHR